MKLIILKKARVLKLYTSERIVKNSNNMKLLLLTATPMSDNSREMNV